VAQYHCVFIRRPRIKNCYINLKLRISLGLHASASRIEAYICYPEGSVAGHHVLNPSSGHHAGEVIYVLRVSLHSRARSILETVSIKSIHVFSQITAVCYQHVRVKVSIREKLDFKF